MNITFRDLSHYPKVESTLCPIYVGFIEIYTVSSVQYPISLIARHIIVILQKNYGVSDPKIDLILHSVSILISLYSVSTL